MTRDRQHLIGLLAGVSALCLGIVSTRSAIDVRLAVSELTYDLLLTAGLLSAAVALAVQLTASLSIPLFHVRYEVAVARRRELTDIQKLAKEEIGESVITLKTLHEWFTRNPTMILVVHRSARSLIMRSTKIVGFFSVVPVTALAATKLKLNREGGFRVTVEAILPNDEIPAAWYIAAVAGRGWWSRGRTVQRLQGYLAAKITLSPHVYAAPTTPDGLRLARDGGFLPTDAFTDPLETIFYRDFRTRARE